jgi:hypothetical protein
MAVLDTLSPNGDDGGWLVGDYTDAITKADSNILTTDDGVNPDALVLDLDTTTVVDADTVTSVDIVITARSTGSGGKDTLDVELLIGGSPVGTTYSTPNLSGTLADYTATGTTQTWTTDYTAAQLNGAQVRITSQQAGKATTATWELDYVLVTINGTAASAGIEIIPPAAQLQLSSSAPALVFDPIIDEDFASALGGDWVAFGGGTSNTETGGVHEIQADGGAYGKAKAIADAEEIWFQIDLKLSSGHSGFDAGEQVLCGGLSDTNDNQSLLTPRIINDAGTIKWGYEYRHDAGSSAGTVSSPALTEDTWYTATGHFKKGTGADGVAELWIDSTQILNATGIDADARTVSFAVVGTINGSAALNYTLQSDNFLVSLREISPPGGAIEISPPAAQLQFSSTAPAVLTPVGITVPAANLQFSTTAPTVNFGYSIEIPAADLQFSTAVPVLAVTDHISIEIPAANLVLSTAAPLINFAYTISPPAAQLQFTTTVPVLNVTSGITIEPPAANLAFSTFVPVLDVTSNVSIEIPAAQLELSTSAPTILLEYRRSPGAAQIEISTAVPTIQISGGDVLISPPAAQLEFSTFAPTLAVPVLGGVAKHSQGTPVGLKHMMGM